MRAARTSLGAILLSLLLALTLVPGAASGTPTGGPQSGVQAAGATRAARALWVPPTGVTFNDPTVAKRRRVILRKVIRSLNSMAAGETARLVSWNLDDRPIVTALLEARKRGVAVKVLVSGAVQNPNWTRLRRGLNRNKTDESFARKCTGGCRTNSRIMHSKIYLFSRVHSAENISMFGSSNLTTPAGNRQWNDDYTTYHRGLYEYLVHVFNEMARDRPVAGGPYEVHKEGPYRVTLFPARGRNPVVDELKRVRCRGATGGTGNGNGRTKIRIAIAGWFDAYGGEIAEKLRGLWDNGCDIKIVTTETGGGVNKIMRSGRGRGPVPMRELSPDRNGDGIPELYLHMKALAISGVYAGDTSSSVVFTGSPNWSTRAQRSEEIWVRLLGMPGVNRRYNGHVDRLFRSRNASGNLRADATLLRMFGAEEVGSGPSRLVEQTPPDWLELD